MRDEWLQYRRELNRSYLVLSEIPETAAAEYRYQMVLKNQIPGLLPCSERYPEGRRSLYFDISSRQSLEQLYEGRKLDMDSCRKLLQAMVQSLEQAAVYLLDESCLCMDTALIFTDAREEEVSFLFLPERQEQEYGRLADFLLAHVDHKEEQAVDLAYRFYQESKFAYFSLEGFIGSIKKELEEPAGRRENGYVPEPVSVPEEEMEDEDLFLPEEEEVRRESGSGVGKIIGIAAAAAVLAAGIYVFFGESLRTGGNLSAENPSAGGLPFWIGPGLLFGGAALFLAGVFLWRRKAGEETAEKEDEAAEWETEENGQQKRTDISWREYESTEFREEETVFLDPAELDLGSLEGEENGKQKNYRLTILPVTVGKMRERAEVLLEDGSVSRIHARIALAEGGVMLTDLNSRNGTYINGERLQIGESRRIQKGDLLRFGRVELRYC